MRRKLIAVVLVLAAAGGLAAGLAYLGGRAGEEVAADPRYAVPVADISCDVPPGVDRAAFLSEVRYLGRLPATVSAVDPRLKDQLAAAFGTHPWVAAVKGVEVNVDRSIRVNLEFRTPRLKVGPRLVDGTGVLLPIAESPPAVTLLLGEWPEPGVEAGRVWQEMKRPAEIAAEFRPLKIEKSDRGWRLFQPDGKTLIVSW